jgi:DNA-binding HxlR family transcriptional regulator
MGSRGRPTWLRSTAPPRLSYQSDILGRSVETLGSKWTLLLLRDMGFLKLDRFSQFLKSNPGLTPRVLSRRLREMQTEGLVVRRADGGEVRYTLTERGADAIYILLAFLRYGLKHPPQHAHETGGARPGDSDRTESGPRVVRRSATPGGRA